jgi:hypothetical protein
MHHEIATWFLVLSLFLPRITLLIAYLAHGVPPNTLPLLGDLALTVLLPRALVVIYIYENMGAGPWFWIHLVVAIAVYVFGCGAASKRRKK